MPQNKQLAAALQKPELMTTTDAQNAIAELAQAENLEAFKGALKKNKDFWQKQEGFTPETDFNAAELIEEKGDTPYTQLMQHVGNYQAKIFLMQADEANLLTIAESITNQTLREKIKITPQENETRLSDADANALRLEAQRKLLLNKINEEIKKANDPQKSQELSGKLSELVKAENDEGFKKALTAFGLQESVVVEMAKNREQLVSGPVALASFCHNFSSIYNALNVGSLLNETPEEFIKKLPQPYTNKILLADVPRVRQLLAQQYVDYKLFNESNVQLLKELAVDTLSLSDFKNKLNADKSMDKFINEAVTEENLKKYKQMAANTALKLSLETSSDKKMLEELVNCKSKSITEDCIGIIKKSDSLGMRKLVTAFNTTGTGLIARALPTAEVRLNLLKADKDALKKLIEKGEPSVYCERYLKQFEQTSDKLAASNRKDLLLRYFSEDITIHNTRNQALIGLAKNQFANLSEEQLKKILDPSDSTFQASVKESLELGNIADDLLVNGAKLLKQDLQAQAQIALTLKQAHNKTPDEIKTLLNTSKDNAHIKNASSADQRQLEAQLASIFIQKYADKANLAELATAGDLEKFKEALKKLGITQVEWVTEEARKEIQGETCERAMNLNIPADRPQLKAMLLKLPFEEQQRLLSNPSKITEIIDAPDVAGVAKSLGKAQRMIDEPVIREFDHKRNAEKIYNSEISRILLTLPSVSLTPKQVEKINDYLARTEIANDNDYKKTVKFLYETTMPGKETEFNRAFGLSDDAQTVTQQAIRQEVITQHQYNALSFQLLNRDNGSPPTPAQKVLAIALLPKPKTTKFDLFLSEKGLQQSSSKEDFAKGLHGFSLTDDQYNAVKQPYKQEMMLKNPDIAAYKEKYDEMDELFTDFLKAEKGRYKKVKQLSELRTIDWLNPAFQASAKQTAHKMLGDYKPMVKDCDVIVTQLSHQHKEIKSQLDNMPSEADIKAHVMDKQKKKDLLAYRQQLVKREAVLREHLETYGNLQLFLKGNREAETESMQKGILCVLEEAKNPQKAIQLLGIDCKITDYPLADKGTYLKGLSAQQSGPTPTTVDDAPSAAYQIVEKVQPGKFRDYTIGEEQGNPAAVGHFIEERLPSDMAPKTTGGQTHYPPSFRFTVSAFPSDEIGKINYSMAMAAQMLAGLDKPPSKEHPLVLKGTNEDELKHLWTALMIMGDLDPKMKFGKDAILVASPYFTPNTTLLGKPSNDVYKNMKTSTFTQSIRQTIKDISHEKEAHKSEEQKVNKDTKAVSRLFKEKFAEEKEDGKSIISQFEEDNKTRTGLGPK